MEAPGKRFLTRVEAADYLGLSRSTLETMASRGGGPPYRKLGRKVLYELTDLDAFVERTPKLAQTGQQAPDDHEGPVERLREWHDGVMEAGR